LTQSDKLNIELNKYIKSFTKKRNMNKIAKEGASIIKRRTRTAGNDINDEKLKKLADSTIRQKRKKGRPQPKKSRLTDTGDMLDAIQGESKKDNSGSIYLNDINEIKKTSWNEKMGRKYFGISPKDEIKLSIFINALFRKTGGL